MLEQKIRGELVARSVRALTPGLYRAEGHRFAPRPSYVVRFISRIYLVL